MSSVVSVQGTIFGFRPEDPFSRNSYDNWLRMDAVAAMLDQRVRWNKSGLIPKVQVAHIRFADFCADPIHAIGRVYGQLGLTLSGEAEQRMADYLAAKPKGVFGAHSYDSGNGAAVASERLLFSSYQTYFHVLNE